MTSAPRLRFAPSPTGYFHVGGARTALFNWLLARQQGGVLILRIEDTDAARNHPQWIDGILNALRWLGIDWDEGPYFQSERAEQHTEAAAKLYADGQAYYCDCTREEIDARAKAAGGPPGYDGHCRDSGLEPGAGRALRFRVPKPGTLHRVDLIRGEADIDLDTIEDFVIVRGNGVPMFLLANTVDDMDMRVTHVVRAEEHLSNVPKAMLLWDALGGGEQPVYAHVPVIVNEKRQKLSKRRDKVAVEDYRAQGYLPEAMVNYLALLGWSPKGDREIVTLQELIDEFRLEDVVPSSAFFDEKKLAHFNGEYIRAMGSDAFVDEVLDFVRRTVLARMGPLVQERVATLAEAPNMVDFFFTETPAIESSTWDKVMAKEGTAAVLDAAVAAYANAELDWTAPVLHETTAALAESLGLKLNKAQAPIRVAVTGRQVGPPLFESLELLGRDRTLARLRAVRGRLS